MCTNHLYVEFTFEESLPVWAVYSVGLCPVVQALVRQGQSGQADWWPQEHILLKKYIIHCNIFEYLKPCTAYILKCL